MGPNRFRWRFRRFFVRRVVAGPRIHLEGKMESMVDESTLNLKVILHGTTQTCWIILPTVTGNTLITLNNVSWHVFRSFTIVWHQSYPESTARFIQQHRLAWRPGGWCGFFCWRALRRMKARTKTMSDHQSADPCGSGWRRAAPTPPCLLTLKGGLF